MHSFGWKSLSEWKKPIEHGEMMEVVFDKLAQGMDGAGVKVKFTRAWGAVQLLAF